MLPSSFYIWTSGILCFGTVSLWALGGFRKGTRCAAGLLLMEYIFWIFCMTVIYRDVQSIRSFNLSPFWSYREILSGNDLLLVQDALNVGAFIPVGLLLGYVFDKIKWWQVLLAGGAISFGIELLQYTLKRGFAEFDDILHNTIGCLIGYGIITYISYWRSKRCRIRIESIDVGI